MCHWEIRSCCRSLPSISDQLPPTKDQAVRCVCDCLEVGVRKRKGGETQARREKKRERSARNSLQNFAGRSARGISDKRRGKKSKLTKVWIAIYENISTSNVLLEVIQAPEKIKSAQQVSVQWLAQPQLN